MQINFRRISIYTGSIIKSENYQNVYFKNIGQDDKIYQGRMHTFTPNVKFLCLTMWLTGLYRQRRRGRKTAEKHDCKDPSAFMSQKNPKNVLLSFIFIRRHRFSKRFKVLCSLHHRFGHHTDMT